MDINVTATETGMPATETPAAAGSRLPPVSRSEKRFYLLVGAMTLLLASAPYLYGWLTTPAGYVYTGLAYNIDDSAVYLAWMRQAASGQFFQRNLFTTEPQQGILFNLFFLLLGGIVRVTQLPLIAVYHGARISCGILVLVAMTGLLRETLSDARARRIAFALSCFAAGLGWLWSGTLSTGALQQPIDNWQPEAVNFLSLYYTPLFAAALAAILWFWTSVLRAERTGKGRDLWPACVSGALLGNFHSYDVIPLFAVWGVYRTVSDILARRLDKAGWARLIVAGLCALPTTAYQAYALRSEPVLYERAFVSNTPSVELWWTLLGFGLLLVFAGLAALRPRLVPFPTSFVLRFLVVWAVVHIAAAYIPVSFQRKLLMGAQIPLYILAGGAIAALTSRLSGDFPRIAAFFAVLLTFPTNALWLQRDISRLSENVGSTPRQPYFTRDEADALAWLRSHARLNEAVLVSPDPASQKRFPFFPLDPYLSVYLPAFGGVTVYNGHWSETARYGTKLKDMLVFFLADTPDETRQFLLREHSIRYVLYANALADGPPTLPDGSPVLVTENIPYIPAAWAAAGAAPGYLTPVYRNAAVTIFRVQ